MNVVWGIRWDRDDDRRRRLLAAVALLAALAAVALLSFSRGAPHGPLQAVIVRAEPNELAAAQRAVEHHGGTIGQSLPVVNGFVAQVPAGSERALGAADGVAGVVADSPMKGWADAGKTAAATAATPGTTLAQVREAIGADQSGATGSGVDVAVIDTGMVPVPALAAQGKVVQGPDFSNQSRDRDLAHLDTYGHGTHVAGIIAGDDPEVRASWASPPARAWSTSRPRARTARRASPRSSPRSAGSSPTATTTGCTSASSTSPSARRPRATRATCSPTRSSRRGRPGSSWSSPPATRGTSTAA